jgi:acyl-CoA synthetase (AMP-forming)/AMP-acid ligase II
MGEAVSAFVVKRPGEEVSVNDLKKFCSERLSSYQAPQFIEFLAELPRNPSGKVLKGDLRKRLTGAGSQW